MPSNFRFIFLQIHFQAASASQRKRSQLLHGLIRIGISQSRLWRNNMYWKQKYNFPTNHESIRILYNCKYQLSQDLSIRAHDWILRDNDCCKLSSSSFEFKASRLPCLCLWVPDIHLQRAAMIDIYKTLKLASVRQSKDASKPPKARISSPIRATPCSKRGVDMSPPVVT